ncbi:phage tail assembly chaperone [Pseudovibrio axinellae]|uniref:phage tail assembly chaperone n=1 Tax=Pseudovibrio axinellae TaxID=989403 RepID=UPI0023AA80EE|nr:phage tail assembly chaperone [Pseudovibrio axinellae]
MTQPFPWHDLLHKACRELGWSPRTFWQATAKELEMALKPPHKYSAHNISRQTLDDLLSRFPDRGKKANS